MSDSACPTCGARVTVVTGGDGTSHYQPQGDRVGIIEHWIAYDPTRPRDDHTVVKSAEAADAFRKTGYTVEGPFVHREQLTGAVEALDTIDALISEVLDTWTWPIRDYADMRPWMRKLIAAVNAGRGQ